MTPFKFAFFTDTHLYPNATQNYAGGLQQQKNSVALYEKLIEQLNAFEPEFVIHGGDIVSGGNSFDMSVEEYETALHTVQILGESMNMPCYYIPGNHDLDPETGSKTSYLERFGINGMGSTCFVKENIRFILLDSQEVPKDLTHGYVSTNQLAWVEREMKKAADYGEEILIFSHQLPFPSVEFQGIGSRIANSAEIIEVVAPFEKQILGFFCGHLHLNRVFREQGMLCIVTSGIICYPMMWRQVFVYPDRIEVKSIRVDLPDVFAESEAVNQDNNLYLSGRPRDQEFTITRTSEDHVD
ncbi:MAG: metallophosphoesterase [Candidatus Poribacteria bacterium]|nr:metallophosphoesterase [Candidatus Poribacteria bacterium]